MSISINWETPSKPNGIIVGYLLEISVANETSVQHQIWIQPDVHQYNYPVKVLCRKYVVKMAAATTAGRDSFISEHITASSPGTQIFLYFNRHLLKNRVMLKHFKICLKF